MNIIELLVDNTTVPMAGSPGGRPQCLRHPPLGSLLLRVAGPGALLILTVRQQSFFHFHPKLSDGVEQDVRNEGQKHSMKSTFKS